MRMITINSLRRKIIMTLLLISFSFLSMFSYRFASISFKQSSLELIEWKIEYIFNKLKEEKIWQHI